MAQTGSVLRLSLIVTLMLLGVGCANKKTTADRDRLLGENRELRAALEQAEADRLTAEDERDRLVGEVNRLEKDLKSRDSEPEAYGNTGFESIENIEVERSPGMIRVNVPGDVLFGSGRVQLRAAAKKTLDRIAEVLGATYTSNVVGIEGHTDNDPIRKSRWKDNLELSVQRAAAVHRYLQSKGIDTQRMYAAGWGENQPRGSKSKSRRVEIVVLTN